MDGTVMRNVSSSAFSQTILLHMRQLSDGDSHSGSTVGTLFIVLAIIMILGIIAGFIGRICAGRHWGGDTQYDFEGWVEKRCASCIDGDIEAPPPPPPPAPAEEKPPAEAAPPAAAPAAGNGAAPAPAGDPPAPAPEGGAPAADAPPPAAEAAPAAAPTEAPKEGEAAAAAPTAAPAEAPAAEAKPEAPAPAPAENLPPPPPPPPPEETAPPPPAYANVRLEPRTYMQFYPSYSCSCDICRREGIFDY
ncbi:hypothetical protein KP509_1Z007500 [Ceratopteris richardii]|nr:hypothetical protein KP509_1Z007500 [Ceratopteris richardii]